jgi:hypothetical protein
MKSGMQTYFFLASYAFRSKVLVLVLVKKDPGFRQNSFRIRIQGVKKHRIPDPKLCEEQISSVPV